MEQENSVEKQQQALFAGIFIIAICHYGLELAIDLVSPLRVRTLCQLLRSIDVVDRRTLIQCLQNLHLLNPLNFLRKDS